MSASLVGSEMCIRDSPCPASPSDLSQCSSVLRRSELAAGHFSGRCIPVSYTHLTLPTICSV
eukprot:9627219-Alexandrium_andersonii.AAC.1